jgi:heavy metal sensor kinase
MLPSIRWRLTLWYSLALAGVLLAFGVLVYSLLARGLYQRLDRVLLDQLQLLEQERQDPRMVRNRHARLAHIIYELKEHANVLCIVYDSTGAVYERTKQLDAASVPPFPTSIPEQTRSEDVTLPLIGRQRSLVSTLTIGDDQYTVVLMTELEELDRRLAQLLTVLCMAGPAALIVAGGLGYVMARKAMAPLEQLDRQTGEITANRLNRRLPVANPGDELGRLAQTINAMIARLERSFAEIRRFTADASHELRTPLTVIRTEAELALDKPLTLAECQQLLGSILEECERLTRMTDQLLALAREDAAVSGSLPDRVDLRALVNVVVETMRPVAETKGLCLRASGNGTLTVRGDEARLRQVFYNLLDNAIKYTPEGGVIEVDSACRGGAAIVTLRDSGIGISQEHLPHVFERFYRVDKARSRAEGGTGLGLSIARSIVAAHGGEVQLESKPGQGTTCTVTLPMEALSDCENRGEASCVVEPQQTSVKP